jgi:uncharacterized membrane protein YkvA (DUF1232 family)
MLRALLIAAILLLATWALLMVAAKRLPPGLLKDLAGFLPACLTTVRRLRNDPRVPRRAKVAILLAGLWLLSPIDLLPEFLPIIGPLDDVLVIALALRYAARRVPREVLLEAWPGEPRLLERLLGPTNHPDQGRLNTNPIERPLTGPPRGSGAAAPSGALRAIDSTARPRSWRTCGPRRLRRQSHACPGCHAGCSGRAAVLLPGRSEAVWSVRSPRRAIVGRPTNRPGGA